MKIRIPLNIARAFVATAAIFLSARAIAADTYDGRVNGFGANVVSYWKFENNGTDTKGVASATITGSPELNVDTVVDLDRIAEGAAANGKVIAWTGAGTTYAQAAHNAAHKTANGTVVVTFQRDTTAAKAVLVAADENETAERGLSIEVTAAGEPRAFLRNASTGAAVVVIGQPGDVVVNEAYTLILKWGASGMSLALWNQSGTLVRRVTNAITTGVSGTSPIRFGAWHTGVGAHDGPFGRVVWLNRRITNTEEATLARARTIVRHAPSGLNATVVGPNQINLAWTDNSPNETGFKIERKTGVGGTYVEIATVTAGTTSYSNTGLTAATNYYYRVAAYNANGNSDYSNEVNATTLTDTYDNRVVGFGANVVSYWKFENTGTDTTGLASATITGSPELNLDTIVDLDRIVEGAAVNGKVIAWPGTAGVYAQAAHNAAHKTANGTVVVTFQRDAAATKSVLVAADANGTAERGLSIEVTATGEPRAFLRNASTGAAVVVLGQPGDVALNQAYTLILKWGAGGMSLALWNQSGTLVRRVTNALATGVTGTSPIRFGAWHTGSDAQHDGLFGRVVWLNRRITDAEETILARARTTVRGAPTGLTATVASHSQINLSWTDNVPNETGFKIERKTGAGGTYAQIATTAANATSYNNTGLVAGTVYYYRVRATNTNHDSAYSNEANATTAVYITTPEAHGWGTVGYNDIQNTLALQAAIDNASVNAGAVRGVVELVPGKTYTVGVSANGTSSSSPVSALTARNNVEIRTAGSPTRASGNQAIVKWHSWAGYADASIKHRNLLWISNVSNFRCGYVQFHGNKNTMPSRFTMDYTSGTNGGMNCVSIRHTISNIVLKELYVTHAGTDGLLASCDSALNVLVEDCNFSRSRRQGMSIGKMNPGGSLHDQLVFRRCIFNDTGDYPGAGEIVGLQPGYGVDIEPDSPTSSVYGVTFDDCDFSDNWGSEYLNTAYNPGTATGYGLRFDCKSTVARFKLINSRGTGNTVRALSLTMRDDSVWDDILIENFVASGNGNDNAFGIGASGGDGTGGRITNARFINCNVTGITWKAGDFPSPWNTGWSVTVWKGNFNPTVTPNGVSTVTVNNGFPP